MGIEEGGPGLGLEQRYRLEQYKEGITSCRAYAQHIRTSLTMYGVFTVGVLGLLRVGGSPGGATLAVTGGVGTVLSVTMLLSHLRAEKYYEAFLQEVLALEKDLGFGLIAAVQRRVASWWPPRQKISFTIVYLIGTAGFISLFVFGLGLG